MYIKNTGEGIGSTLIDKLLEEIDREQWKYLFVRTWVEPVNEGAIKFYTEKELKLISIRPGITDISSIVFSDEGDILAGVKDPDLLYNQIIRP